MVIDAVVIDGAHLVVCFTDRSTSLVVSSQPAGTFNVRSQCLAAVFSFVSSTGGSLLIDGRIIAHQRADRCSSTDW